MKRPAVLALLPVAALALAACGSSSGDAGGASSVSSSSSGPSGSITVLAAASLQEAFTQLGKDVEATYPGTTIHFGFGASSALSTQITQGKPADVFASASTKNMDTVVQAGDASSPKDFVSNTLEIAVPPSNPAGITQVSDLARKGVKVATCAAAVPCGVVARQVFTNAKITVKPVAQLEDVKTTLSAVESGEVDAGLVYVTDVRAAGSKVKGVEIPAGVNARTTYPIATLKDAKNAALAKAFVDLVLSDAGQKVLRADGFSAP